jgi:hypothetical protein
MFAGLRSASICHVAEARFEITYPLDPDPPPAMPWTEYEQRLRAAWEALLRSEPDEPNVQAFLEEHPCLIPGAHEGIGGMKSGRGPFPSAVITQPSLKGLRTRTPDFAWVASDSVFLSPVFVEIEAPGKPWMTRKGVPRAELTQALHQIEEWKAWFAEPLNRQLFCEQYQIPRQLVRYRKWAPVWLLIYGRQGDDARVRKLRGQLRTEDRVVIPYDHLEPHEDSSDYLCVRNHQGAYRAVSVPRPCAWGPGLPRIGRSWRARSVPQKSANGCPRHGGDSSSSGGRIGTSGLELGPRSAGSAIANEREGRWSTGRRLGGILAKRVPTRAGRRDPRDDPSFSVSERSRCIRLSPPGRCR